MNDFNENLLKALAQTTRFKLTDETSSASASAAWLVAIRSLMGVAYALLASLIMWLIKVPAAGLILAAIALFALHSWLTAGREMKVPSSLCRRLFPNAMKDENPSMDLLCNIVPFVLTLLLMICMGTMWIPAIMAIGTAAAAELSVQQTAQNFSFRHPKAWLVAAIFIVVFQLLPCIFSRTLFQAVFLRAAVLFAMTMLIVPWFRQLKARSTNFTTNCVFMSIVLTVATIIVISI